MPAGALRIINAGERRSHKTAEISVDKIQADRHGADLPLFPQGVYSRIGTRSRSTVRCLLFYLQFYGTMLKESRGDCYITGEN